MYSPSSSHRRLLNFADCKTISDPAVKKRLTDLTQEALDDGCFGAPWWIITNSKGETESFFGSDRWDHVCDYLGEKFVGYFPAEAQTSSRL